MGEGAQLCGLSNNPDVLPLLAPLALSSSFHSRRDRQEKSTPIFLRDSHYSFSENCTQNILHSVSISSWIICYVMSLCHTWVRIFRNPSASQVWLPRLGAQGLPLRCHRALVNSSDKREKVAGSRNYLGKHPEQKETPRGRGRLY